MLINSDLHSVGAVLQEQQAKDPKAQITYFEVVPEAEGDGFKLKLQVDVHSWQCSRGGQEAQLTAECCKHGTGLSGLMPLRPLVCAVATGTGSVALGVV